MPDLDMTLATLPNVGLHPEQKMSIKNRKWKPWPKMLEKSMAIRWLTWEQP
jgi:hypothetical protein